MNLKLLCVCLLASACSGGVESLGNAGRGDFTTGLLCGWSYKKDQNLGSTAGPEVCWRVVPSEGTSVMPPGADACDAREGTTPRIWASGAEVALFTKTSTSGKAYIEALPVECP